MNHLKRWLVPLVLLLQFFPGALCRKIFRSSRYA